jgi:hypothetical protein
MHVESIRLPKEPHRYPWGPVSKPFERSIFIGGIIPLYKYIFSIARSLLLSLSSSGESTIKYNYQLQHRKGIIINIEPPPVSQPLLQSQFYHLVYAEGTPSRLPNALSPKSQIPLQNSQLVLKHPHQTTLEMQIW